MIKKTTLDFANVDIEEYLYPRIPVRFQDTDPREFEAFIGLIFEANGYSLNQTTYSPEFGADLLVEFQGESTAIQVRRYHEGHKVGIQDLKQLAAAQEYYRCANAMMVTTSSFDQQAKRFATDKELILWDWYRLHQMIADTFLEGSYDQYYEKYPVVQQSDDTNLSLRLVSIELAGRKLSLDGRTIVHAELENKSNQPLQVYCDLPVYITHERKQFNALEFTSDSFHRGEVLNQAVVPISFVFSARHLTKYHRQDRVLLRVHAIKTGEVHVLEQKMKRLKKECFFITFGFGRDSAAYVDMVRFRDEYLSRGYVGRLLIDLYYMMSRRLVSEISRIPYADRFIKPLLMSVVSFCRLFLTSREEQN